MTDSKKPSVWEATELRPLVEEIMTEDPRFVGLSRYLASVFIYWSTEIPTACAGHGFIFFNPTFWDAIPPETQKTVIAHEVWHLILRHLERGKECDPEQHNIAADHVINLNLETDGFTFEGVEKEGDIIVVYKDKKYKGQSTETIYNTIYEEQKKKPKPKTGPEHVPAELIEDMIEDALQGQGKGITLDKQKQKNEENVKAHGEKAGDKAGNRGIKLDLTRTKVLVIGTTYPKIFKKYLIDPLTGGKRTFMRPNRRQHGAKGNTLRMPGRYPKRGHLNRLTHLVWALDVSGSITQQQAQQSHDGIRTIKDLLNPALMTILYFDTRIVMEKTFTDNQPYTDIQVNAGGGTSLTGVYKRTKEINPEALVIFTDLAVRIPPKPDWDCIWIVPDKRTNIPLDLYGDLYLIPGMV